MFEFEWTGNIILMTKRLAKFNMWSVLVYISSYFVRVLGGGGGGGGGSFVEFVLFNPIGTVEEHIYGHVTTYTDCS